MSWYHNEGFPGTSLSQSLSCSLTLSRGELGKDEGLTIRLARSCRRGPPPSPSRNQRPAACIPLCPPLPSLLPFPQTAKLEPWEARRTGQILNGLFLRRPQPRTLESAKYAYACTCASVHVCASLTSDPLFRPQPGAYCIWADPSSREITPFSTGTNVVFTDEFSSHPSRGLPCVSSRHSFLLACWSASRPFSPPPHPTITITLLRASLRYSFLFGLFLLYTFAHSPLPASKSHNV
ncbi:hypothetical protein LZ30DRAFT_224999 [Colletotrichum cereale]|nr:hypothetical protein LZ30DRAFT_224999 [Colletotrichum cereale]